MNIPKSLQRYLPGALIAVVFVVLSLVYFAPAVLEGKDLFQLDVAGASGIAQDVRTYEQATGEVSYWTNSLFSGMPMYQISPSYPSLSLLKHLQDFYTLQWPLDIMPSYSWLLWAMFVGFFLFLRLLGVRTLPSALGAVMWALSSYFIILIDAGHIWKLTVLAFVPPTIGGIADIYRGNYLRGGLLTAFFASLQLMSNHVQMSYYFGFLIVFLLIAYLVEAKQSGNLRQYMYATLTLSVAALIAIGTNSSNLYHTYKYTQETMRGGSALSQGKGDEVPGGASGLDREYITQWSYGKAETLTLLIPNAYGGSTGGLGHKPELLEATSPELRPYLAQMNQYWGDQPFTSGPVYVGAFVLLLSILGLFVVRTPLKWALFAATLLSVLLSWGKNMMWLTDLFIDYIPLYNKFRTVSSILVVAEFTIPTLAILALVEFVRDPKVVLAQRQAIIVATSLTAGLALVVAIAPGLFFDFVSDQEAQMFSVAMAEHGELVSGLITALREIRASVVSADAWRSFFAILLSSLLCFCYAKGWFRQTALFVLLGIITLVDLWSVDKRYLNDEKFIPQSLIAQRATPITDIDRQIAKDPDPHYRVLNLATSTFQDATTSYMHRSIGGYHAAKLSRYQDLIEHQLIRNNSQVLDMLDVRYIISADSDGALRYSQNTNAFGAAWFVDSVHIAPTAQMEMKSLEELDLRQHAVVHKEMTRASVEILAREPRREGTTSVQLLAYTPNYAKYKVHTDEERLLVFSEIYYPHGWTLTIDGQAADILRANYTLRAAVIPKGMHELEMKFAPQSIQTTERIAVAAQVAMFIALVVLLWGMARRRKK